MLLFYNGVIHTMDEKFPAPEAVLVDDNGRIAAVGSMSFLEPELRDGKRIDLGGKTLIPGFNDAHAHVWKIGLIRTSQVDVRFAVAPDIPTVISRLRARAEATPVGGWVNGRGYNEAQLAERRHLTRADLDQASADRPIAVTRTCGHMIVANSAALVAAGITANTPNPPGGLIVHDEHGGPTGLLQESAMGLIEKIMPEPTAEEWARVLHAAMQHELSLGMTSSTDPLVTPDILAVYMDLDAHDALDLRINAIPIRRPDGGKDTYPLPLRHESARLRVDSVKFFADGGLSGATAAISVPYKETGTLGVLRFDTEELIELMWEAHDSDFRIATHAIGDIAIEQVLGAYETIHARKHKPELRHRIEHLGLPSADHLRRAKALNLIAVPQTVFLPALGANFQRYLPDEFIPRCYPVRAMLDAGLTVALSSDAPVVPDDNPLLGMKAAIDRKAPNGQPIAPEQAITAYEALYGYTMGGAIASGDQHNRGSISPGKWADLTILSGDPLATEPDGLLGLKALRTYVGGKLAYEA